MRWNRQELLLRALEQLLLRHLMSFIIEVEDVDALQKKYAADQADQALKDEEESLKKDIENKLKDQQPQEGEIDLAPIQEKYANTPLLTKYNQGEQQQAVLHFLYFFENVGLNEQEEPEK